MVQKIRAWFALSRPPFHTVGLLPFVLGSVLAWRFTATLRWDILAWGMAGVVLVMLATYYAGEYWDQREDSLSVALGPSRFSGGSRVLQAGLLPQRSALWASVTALFLALLVASILQLGYQTGPLTIPFCILGLVGVFFYSTRPVRWVATGVGELWIAFCLLHQPLRQRQEPRYRDLGPNLYPSQHPGPTPSTDGRAMRLGARQGHPLSPAIVPMPTS